MCKLWFRTMFLCLLEDQQNGSLRDEPSPEYEWHPLLFSLFFPIVDDLNCAWEGEKTFLEKANIELLHLLFAFQPQECPKMSPPLILGTHIEFRMCPSDLPSLFVLGIDLCCTSNAFTPNLTPIQRDETPKWARMYPLDLFPVRENWYVRHISTSLQNQVDSGSIIGSKPCFTELIVFIFH